MANNKNKNNKSYDSMWDMLLTIGVWKTFFLLWSIYLTIYVIAMGILYWMRK